MVGHKFFGMGQTILNHLSNWQFALMTNYPITVHVDFAPTDDLAVVVFVVDPDLSVVVDLDLTVVVVAAVVAKKYLSDFLDLSWNLVLDVLVVKTYLPDFLDSR